MATYNKNGPTSSTNQSTETITIDVDIDVIQDSDFQEFVKKIERSHDVLIIINENYGMVIISGNKLSVNKSKIQIQNKISPTPSESTIKLSVAQINFLQLFGEQIFDRIHMMANNNSAAIKNGQLQLSADNNMIELIKTYLKETLHEENIQITASMKTYLESTNHGSILTEFLQKYRVGSSFQRPNRSIKHSTRCSRGKGHINLGQQRESHHNSHNRGRGRGSFDQSGRGRDNFDQPRGGRGSFNQSRRGRGNFDHPREDHGNFSQPGRGRENFDQPRGGRGSFDQSGRGRGNFDQPGRGRGNFDQPGRGRGNSNQSGRGRGNFDHPREDHGNFSQLGRGRGQYGRGNFSVNNLSSSLEENLRNLNLNTSNTNSNENIFGIHRDDENDHDKEENLEENGDDFDDNSSTLSDSNTSTTSSCSTKDFEKSIKQLVTITLCSDSKDSLFKAVEELRNYPFYSQQFVLTPDKSTFILKQLQRGKSDVTNNSFVNKAKWIKTYLARNLNDYSIHVYTFYYRGIWHARLNGSKEGVQSAILKMQSYLNDVVETEVQIPISPIMTSFLIKKVLSDIRKLEKQHNIKIIIKSRQPQQYKDKDNDNEQNNMSNCLKLIGTISRIKTAQEDVEIFLENLIECEEHFTCLSWDIAKKISDRVFQCLKKINQSDDYNAIVWNKNYSPIERREANEPKVTIIIVCLDKETKEDIIQQCTDIYEGYFIWKLTTEEYRAINLLKRNKLSSIETFQHEWDVQLQFDSDTVIIPARSKMIAEEIKEALLSLCQGHEAFNKKITEVIPVPRNIRAFVLDSMRPIFDQAKAQKVIINSKNYHELKLYGFSKSVIPIKQNIITLINDIERNIIKHNLTLSLVESELFRANSYKIIRRIESETKTIIRDVTTDNDRLNANKNNESISSIIISVANYRGQTIHIQKGDITKIQDVDAIVNAANGTLQHSGGIAKTIRDAAGPILDEECQQLITQNQGMPISTGTAVKTTSGNLPFKAIIHAIGPQYKDGNKQERPLLFKCILATLRLAEEEHYKSLALPAISSVIYGFPLQDCTLIIIRAIKQFFADYPQSDLRKIILLDIDDAACNSFARELTNNHVNIDENDAIMKDNSLPLVPLTARWCWKNNNNEEIYNEDDTRQIENEFQQFLQKNFPSKLILSVDALKDGKITDFSIHFLPDLRQQIKENPNALNTPLKCGYQKNIETGWPRNIIRYPMAQQQQQSAKQIDKYRPKPLDRYQIQVIAPNIDWVIIATTIQAIQRAETRIQDEIKSASISEVCSIVLSNNIETHQNTICNLILQLSVQVEFQPVSGGRLSMILKGFQQNVSKARDNIVRYEQDIQQTKMQRDNQLSTPPDWIDQDEPFILADIPRNHSDFIRIEDRMKQTMKNIKIDRIERVQNLRLWNCYVLKREGIQQRINNRPDVEIEMELFHGTRNTPPNAICNGEHGFDTTYSSQGLWGTGTYFAKNASYSCSSYSYSSDNGKRQVFLAQVLTGEVYDYKTKTDNTLRRPPPIPGRIPSISYDSVSGETGGSQVYIIYYPDLAYPTYLITFTP